MQLLQSIFYFAFNTPQLLLFADNRFPLQTQLFFHAPHIPVPQKVRDLRQRHIQCPQVPYGVQHLKLPCAVIAVPCLRVYPLRLQQAGSLIVAQAADTQVKKLCHISNGKQFDRLHRLPPGTGCPLTAGDDKISDDTDQHRKQRPRRRGQSHRIQRIRKMGRGIINSRNAHQRNGQNIVQER